MQQHAVQHCIAKDALCGPCQQTTRKYTNFQYHACRLPICTFPTLHFGVLTVSQLVSQLVVRFCKTRVKNHKRRGSQTNRWDFNSFVNVKNDKKSRMVSGRLSLFQMCGPATANKLSQNEVCVRVRAADLIPGRWSTQRENSARYSKARPLGLRHLCTIASL